MEFNADLLKQLDEDLLEQMVEVSQEWGNHDDNPERSRKWFRGALLILEHLGRPPTKVH